MFSSSSAVAFPCHLPQTSTTHKLFKVNSFHPKRSATPSVLCLRIGVEEVAEVVHNKVLVSASVASLIGQISKPFTSVLYGRGFDIQAAVRAGGMPSTHSASVVAIATCLGLERGFSDSIFGMSVVLAGLIMYDAQGVRREVGIHARVLNRTLLKTKNVVEEGCVDNSGQEVSSINSESLAPLLSVSRDVNSSSSPPSSSLYITEGIKKRPNSNSSNLAINCKDSPYFSVNGEETRKLFFNGDLPLKESIGHTELEVVVGALLGFLVSLIIESIL
ncbi:hypothetical protein H6P81_014201 [Aristolochia fimbriata]|uniref:Acid phosphatase/vanadium-dependent haloperoxidase-related protein n=1 Tax=Aristolochia fimbriata TaxID=158543 RepID=A0AAV7EGV0_ARIFI|nr:hypothetical protein H6P81_014201 [Aristolochia fimbriata]